MAYRGRCHEPVREQGEERVPGVCRRRNQGRDQDTVGRSARPSSDRLRGVRRRDDEQTQWGKGKEDGRRPAQGAGGDQARSDYGGGREVLRHQTGRDEGERLAVYRAEIRSELFNEAIWTTGVTGDRRAGGASFQRRGQRRSAGGRQSDPHDGAVAERVGAQIQESRVLTPIRLMTPIRLLLTDEIGC